MSQSKKQYCSKCNKIKSFYKLEDECCRSCHVRSLRQDPEIDHFTQKRCNKCKEIFDLSEFSTKRGTYLAYCKHCNSEIVNEWKKARKPFIKLEKSIKELRNCVSVIFSNNSIIEAESYIDDLEHKLEQLILNNG